MITWLIWITWTLLSTAGLKKAVKLNYSLTWTKSDSILHMACFRWNHLCLICWLSKYTGPWFNIKMTSYQYKKSHCGDKTILRPSYLHNGISYTGKTTSLYWIGAQMLIWRTFGLDQVKSKPLFLQKLPMVKKVIFLSGFTNICNITIIYQKIWGQTIIMSDSVTWEGFTYVTYTMSNL